MNAVATLTPDELLIFCFGALFGVLAVAFYEWMEKRWPR